MLSDDLFIDCSLLAFYTLALKSTDLGFGTWTNYRLLVTQVRVARVAAFISVNVMLLGIRVSLTRYRYFLRAYFGTFRGCTPDDSIRLPVLRVGARSVRDRCEIGA